MVKNIPYTCPRCEYSAIKKQHMENHFKRQKLCGNLKNVDLTPEIIAYVFKNKIYHPPKNTNIQNKDTEEVFNNSKVKRVSFIKETNGFSYLLQTRESIRCNDEVFKIGRSRDINRPNDYPKGSVVIRQAEVIDQYQVEKELLANFREKFQSVPLYGNEYFSGDLIEMVNLWQKIVDRYVPAIIRSNANVIPEILDNFELSDFQSYLEERVY